MEKEQYLPLEEFIRRAQVLGVDLGKGNPKNRLRYYVKLGLLPHVERKVFGKKIPTGAWPISVLKKLVEIDKKLKQGKSIAQIKREIEKESGVQLEEKEKNRIGQERVEEIEKGSLFELFKEKKIFYLISNVFAIFLILFLGQKLINSAPFSKLLATLWENKKLSQIDNRNFVLRNEPLAIFKEPYLAINAETNIKNQLSVTGNLLVGENLEVEKTIRGENLILKGQNFSGKITIAELSEDREYTFPDSSGIICLSSGNCFGLGGEVTSPGGTLNRLAKFIGERRIGNSSIQDFFAGVSLTIDPKGNIGIGTQNPTAKLEIAGSLKGSGLEIKGNSSFDGDIFLQGNFSLTGDLQVKGKIRATGDICTDENGGKCLSQLITWFFGGGGGIAGSGRENFLPIWLGGNRLGESIIFQNGNLVSIAGSLRVNEFYLPTGASPGKFLMALDETGKAVWTAIAASLPEAQENQTLRYGKFGWEATSFLWNTGSQIGIGTTSTTAMVTVAGDIDLRGPLRITDFLSEYLKLALNSDEALIESTKKIIINSLSGEVTLGNNVSLFDASNSAVKALTFLSADDDATVRKSGEKILRSVVPIFKFSLPTQTNSSDFQEVSREATTSTLASVLPPRIPGTERKFALLINFADNIPQNSSSTWQIDFENLPDITFEFQGQNLSSLEVGSPFLRDNLTGLLDDNWVLKVKVPTSSYSLRVFNILLLVYDEVK